MNLNQSASVETEVKIRISNQRQLKRRLRDAGFWRVAPRRFERNSLFDFPDGRLARAGCAVRLRVSGGEALLTFKGAASVKLGYKSREEIESGVQSAAALRVILTRLGLREAFAYAKRRTLYAASGRGGVVAFDETPAGDFIEIEGSRRWIDRTAKLLGFGRDEYIAAGYPALYREAAKRA